MTRKTAPADGIKAKIDPRKLIELVPAMIAVYNINTGKYVYVNQAVKKILGYTPDDFINGGTAFVTGLVHSHDLPQILGKNQSALERSNNSGSADTDSDPIASFEYRMKHKNGKWIWMKTDGMVYSRSPDGNVEYVVNVSIDMTERKKSEDDLKKLTDQLVAVNTSKDEFVAIASHQLRTPATAVKQYLGLILEGYSDPLTEGQETFLRLAYENNDRQLHIVEEILKVTQLDLDKVRLKPEHTDLLEVAIEAIDALQGTFSSRKQRVFVKKNKGPVISNIDKEQIRIAIENLLENASNYSRGGKEIRVIVASGETENTIEVRDEGVGIKPADLAKLFQKFSRIPNPLSVRVGGTGLGLYWALRIVKLHGGKITVDSKPGKGSAFVIHLPTE